jgi:hypothetical protein
MDDGLQIGLLKKLLLKEVSSFCRNDKRRWKQPISATISEVREQNWEAVFFGGTLRSLLLSRLKSNSPGRPRDIDIVLNGATLNDLRQTFKTSISRETRFGGLQLKRVAWQFDVWPLNETYAFKEESAPSPSFEDLPSTTFFNVEAIAVEVWPKPGLSRRVFSGDDQFFHGVLDRTIEVNRLQNPFPELCVVRSIVMAANLAWKVGPRLLRYLAEYGGSMSSSDFENIQKKHYGGIQWPSLVFESAIKEIKRVLDQNPQGSVELPLPKQLTFWQEEEQYRQRIRLRTMRFKSLLHGKV